MFLVKILSFVCAAATLSLAAAELPDGVVWNRNGSFHIGDAEFCIQNYSSSWSPSTNANWKDRHNRDGLSLTATMKVGSQPAAVAETVNPAGDNQFTLRFEAKFLEQTRVNALFGVFQLPARAMTVTIDDKPVELPGDYQKMILYQNFGATRMSFGVAGGKIVTVTGDPLNLSIQDNRKFGDDTFAFRFGATPSSGELTESKLALTFRVDPEKAREIDLSAAANRGFADSVAGDGKGGWTDQGPANDLRMLKPGPVKVDGVVFLVTDAAKNGGRGAIVVAGKGRGFSTPSVTLALPENHAGAVSLLHASAWTPKSGQLLGTIVAGYADGSSERIPVFSRIDCGNWWNPVRGRNAVIGWNGENSEASLGLYASSFAWKKPGPNSLRFEIAAPDAVWMIAGATLTESPVRFLAGDDKPLTIREGLLWKPLVYRHKIVRGSALDFSFLADAPAGKYGWIEPAPDGTLSFSKAPGKRIRLYGVNLCFTANYLTKSAVDKLADYLLYCGYNSVRIHHYDTLLLDRNASDTVTLNPEQLDKLDYLLYRMKEKGIYVVTDLYTNRTFKPGDRIPECDFYDQRQMKTLIPVSRAAMANWKTFARRLMTHRNPYTGLTWAADPALFCVNLVNEDTLTGNWSCSPSSVKLYEAAFRKYCAENQLAADSASNGNPVFLKFLQTLQDRVLKEQLHFVKKELGMKALVTSLNYLNEIPLTLMRRRFDVVDDHAYFDHPGFPEKPWRLPFSYRQGSAISQMAVVPRGLMASRIPGKPFLVTEFNYCNPNIYRAEAGPLVGGYAALQNWDGLYRFAWSHDSRSIYSVGDAYGFNAVNDPMAQLSDRIAIAMFRRGDVSAARITYAYTVPWDCFTQKLTGNFPDRFTRLGLISGIGSIPYGESNVPANVVQLSPFNSTRPDRLEDRETAALWERAIRDKVAESVTGQLRLDGKADSFTVVSPRSESITLNAGSLAAGTLRVRDASCFQTVAAISLDGKPIAESGSILVIQLTDVSNTGLAFGNGAKTRVTGTGNLPLLVRRGSATVELSSARPYRVTALDCDGAPYGPVPGTYREGVFRFKADTTLFPGGVMAYHLTR